MIGNRIKQLRDALSLTQAEFGAKLGMTNSAVHEWEHNKVEIKDSSLLLIELVFNVTPDWLRNGKGYMFLPALEEDAARVLDWLKSLSSKDQIWASKEIVRQIPEFRKWLENK